MVPSSSPPQWAAYFKCRNYVEPDSPSAGWCKACIAQIDIQRARGALRAKMPAIMAGRCKAKHVWAQADGCRLPQVARLTVARLTFAVCRLPQVAGPMHLFYIFHKAGMRMYGAHLLRTGFKKVLIMKIFEFLP